MIAREQIQDLEEWLTDQPDVSVDYSFDCFGFWYSGRVAERFIYGGVTDRDETTPLLAIQRHVEAVRRNPGIGHAEPPAEHTKVYGPGDAR